MKASKRIIHIVVEIVALVAVLFMLLPLVREQLEIAQRVGNRPSSQADAPSEADALTSGMHYYLEGFLKHMGLPDRGGPPHKLYDDPSDVPNLVLIYTHYPPGPNWLTGLAIMTFGPKQVPLYRLFPISFSVAGLLLTYALIRNVLGAILAAAAVIVLLQVPMTTWMMHGLFYHPYAITLVLVQMSFLFNRLEKTSRLSWRSLYLLAGMSFIQGWLSFDWCFVVMFAPFAVVSCWRDSTRRWEMVRAASFCVVGFTCAHVLHFAQVWAFRSSLAHAFEDLFGAARFRMLGDGPKLVPENGTVVILQKYILTLFPSFSQASYFSWLLPAVGVLLAVVLGALGRLTRGDCGGTKLFAPALISMAMGFAISLLWILVMKNHALEPGHWLFLPRHLIIFLFSCVLVSGVALSSLTRMSMALLARSRRFR